MIKKTILGLLLLSSLVGCSNEKAENESYLEIKPEIASKIVKNTYTCEDDEFFFIEKTVGARIINFIYGSYSSALSKKTYSKEIYSDGVYNVSFSNDEAFVKMQSEIVLENCKKI